MRTRLLVTAALALACLAVPRAQPGAIKLATVVPDGSVWDKALKQMATHMDLGYYRKSKRGPKRPPPKMDEYRNGGHVSTYKLLRNKDP